LKIKTFEKDKSLGELLKNKKNSTNVAKGEDESRLGEKYLKDGKNGLRKKTIALLVLNLEGDLLI
jgi:hypothetical protein